MRFKEFYLKESKDPNVLAAQEILKRDGYNLGPTGVDGVLGPWTIAAIDAYNNDIPPEKAKTPATGTANAAGAGAQFKGFGKKFDGKLPVNAQVGQGFKGTTHPGVDIPVPVGTPVVCPVDGVIEVAASHPAAGNYVNVKTADGGKQRFLHLSQISVQPGEKIKAGDVIGLSGNTGKSTGPHLHWEKWAGNDYSSATNPLA